MRAEDVETAYRVVDGISYSSRTPEPVIEVLEAARKSGKRIRLHLGDPVTGRDWLEEHDVEGLLGNSRGPTRIPLLIYNRANHGGHALLDDAIVAVKAASDRRTLYRHPNFHTGKFEVVTPTAPSFATAVTVDGRLHAQFKLSNKLRRWLTRFGN